VEKEQSTEDSPRQSFRAVGGAEAAKVEIKSAVSVVPKVVVLTSIRNTRFLVVPVRDTPADGFSIKEDGYEAEEAKGYVTAHLGPDAYLDAAVWAQAISIVRSGGKVKFVLGPDPIEVGDEKKFPVEIQRDV